jgi:hypothetical protein
VPQGFGDIRVHERCSITSVSRNGMKDIRSREHHCASNRRG